MSTLRDWDDVASLHPWTSLLLGNGFSTNIWSGFGYRRLFDVAPLHDRERELFAELGTTDFEVVLSSLEEPHRHDVREALFGAIRAVHPQWRTVAAVVNPHEIGARLAAYDRIFSLNYDLLLHWSLAAYRARAPFEDLMPLPGAVFDPRWPDGGRTVRFLHGSLHLWHRRETGDVGKLVRERRPDGDLLRQVRAVFTDDRQALMVSEGTAAQKEQRIRETPYLADALAALQRDRNPLVVLGASLAESDAHVLRAIRGRGGPLAVAIHAPHADSSLPRLASLLDGTDVTFFDAATHPLTTPAWRAG